jgi:hypothetical protein
MQPLTDTAEPSMLEAAPPPPPPLTPPPLPPQFPPPAAAFAPVPRWRLSTRIAFRFCFLYFGLYILLTQMNFIPFIPPVQRLAPVAPTVFWVIKNVFNDDRTLEVLGGSGDKMFDYVFVLCLFVFSALLTLFGPRSIAGGRITCARRSGFASTCASGWPRRCWLMG